MTVAATKDGGLIIGATAAAAADCDHTTRLYGSQLIYAVVARDVGGRHHVTTRRAARAAGWRITAYQCRKLGETPPRRPSPPAAADSHPCGGSL